MARYKRLAEALGGAMKRAHLEFDFNDLTAAALTQELAIKDLPPGAIVMGFDVEVETAFAGTTTLVVDLGDAGGAEYADDVNLQAEARTSGMVAVANSDGNGVSVTALVTATGANVDQCSAGSAKVGVLYIEAEEVPKRFA